MTNIASYQEGYNDGYNDGKNKILTDIRNIYRNEEFPEYLEAAIAEYLEMRGISVNKEI